ncbi:PAS domain-containing protein [Oculatella sp. LEGE 06141]|uniref:PAS domain-containing protein n=1 Tax=Oculatella sp. LEGE 06141 TaxID=1828648 RepID=UPI00187F63F1|nr:PAS domain-containing protein [Oculatella sp. LEGE 06141]MBE9178576.1 PAS domain-containing protein [Oculatella sp. LEGE 06141]
MSNSQTSSEDSVPQRDRGDNLSSDSVLEDIAVLQARNAELERQLEQTSQALSEREAYCQATETKLNGILNNTSAAIASFRAYKYRQWEYEYRSAGCEVVFGYTVQEFLSYPDLWRSRVFPKDLDTVITPAIAAIFAVQTPSPDEKQTAQVEYRFQHKDGNLRWISETFTAEWRQEGDCWVITTMATDISDRKRTEAALRHSRDFVQRITDDSPHLLYIFDLVAQRNTYVNRQIAAILGYTQEEVNQQGAAFFLDRWHPDDLPHIQQNVQRLESMADGVVMELEYRMRHQNGSWRWLQSRDVIFERDDTGRPIKILGTAIDITERKDAELVLQQQEELIRAIGDNLPNGAIYQICQELDGLHHFTYFSAGIERISEVKPEEILQNPAVLFSQVLEEDQAKLDEAIENAKRYQSPIDLQIRKRTPSGRLVWSHLRSAVRCLPDGRIVWDGVEFDVTEQKLLEEHLRQSESRYQAAEAKLNDILNSAGAAIASFHVVSDRPWEPVYYSAGCMAIFGFTPEEMMQGVWWSHVLPDDLQAVIIPATETIVSQGVARIEYRFRHNDGSLRWIESTRTSQWDETLNGWRVSSVDIDITERKRAEEALRQYERIVSATSDEIALVDRNYRYRFVNQAYVERHGKSYDDIIGHTMSEVIDQDDFATTIKPMLDRALAGETLRYETYHESATGVSTALSITYTPYFELNGTISGVVASIRNITELKQVEEALRQSEQRYALAVNAGKVGVWDWNLETNDIYVDPMLKSLLGYDDAEINNRLEDWASLVHSDDQPIMQQTAASHIEGQTPIFELEHRMLHKDGSIRWLLARGHAIRDGDGRPYRIIGTDTDITDRKQAELALHHQLEKEQRLNRVIQAIRNSLDLSAVFSTAAEEILELSQIDWMEIVQYHPDQQLWRTVANYRRTSDRPERLGVDIPDEGNAIAAQLKRLEVIRVDDTSQIQDEFNLQAAQMVPGSWLLIPLQIGSMVWGALSLAKSQPPSTWQDAEVEVMVTIANQLAIAIQQSELYQQIQAFNTNLEQQIEARTAELQHALHREAALKGITNAVRYSLDEAQILQTVVQELGRALSVLRCTAALYNADYTLATISDDYTLLFPSVRGRTVVMSDYAEEFQQLLSGQPFQVCLLSPQLDLARSTILACPIVSDQDVLGDLCLVKPAEQIFDPSEVGLIEQVANQCAIALRQSRLYQEIQSHARELESLSILKDEFLSTVSHELRSPMANIKMAAQMLEIVLRSQNHQDFQVNRYFQILREECDRETNLINDLLDLSRLESGQIELEPTSLDLKDWLPAIAEPFEERARNQQQLLLYRLPDNLPLLRVDEPYLQRILTELLHNACKYTPTHEQIIVAVELHENNQPDASLLLTISVTNTGVEIPEQERERVFDKFYRIPNNDPWKHGGTGLGLALVKKLVKCLGASIQLDSSVEQTTFTLKFSLDQ